MALALGCSLLASVLCLRGAAGPWRTRLHHLLPTPLMALGMGHAGPLGGLPAAAAAAAGLWVLGVVLARGARRGPGGQGPRPVLWADAVDAFAMAVALLVPALVGAAAGAPPAGGSVATLTGHGGHVGHATLAAPLPLTGEGGALVGVTAGSLAVAVVLVRVVLVGAVLTGVGGGAGRAWSSVSRTLPPALLMAASLVVMLAV